MGDAGLFVTGDAVENVGGALLVASDDPGATAAFVDEVGALAADAGFRPRPVEVDEDAGFEITDAGLPVVITLGGGERFVLAVDQSGDGGGGGSAVARSLDQGGTLSDTALFTRARSEVGDGMEPQLFVDVRDLLDVVRSAFGTSSEEEALGDAEPYLENVSFIAAGTRREGDLVLQRIVIGAAEP